MFAFTNPGFKNMNFSNWGLFSQSEYSGFGMVRSIQDSHSVIDYRYSLGFGDKSFALGINYGFTGGDKGYFRRSNTLGWGMMLRPSNIFSFTLFQNYALDNNDGETVVDVAIRPIPNYLVTFFADYVMDHNKKIQDGNWSAGVNWEFIDGIRLTGRYFDNKSFNVSLDFSLRYFGIGNITGMNKDSKVQNTTSYIKFGGPDRSFLSNLCKRKSWVTYALNGSYPYIKGSFFDNSVTFFELISKLDETRKDDDVVGIMLDARKMSFDMEKMWEVREKLEELKASGKKVIIYLERAGFGAYYFASVADKIVLDPLGSVDIRGISMTMSYYKNFLEKLGIGYEELRLFKYKSAYETFAKDTMSDGDREQKQRIIDEWYDVVKDGITKGRNISRDKYDEIVNARIFYSAKTALKEKLVDTLGRWEDRDNLLSYFESSQIKEEKNLFSKKEIEPFDDKWGANYKSIAIFYLQGSCSMEGGINARKNAKLLKSLAENDNIKGIILRVDSPGGDAMASDYIAEVVRKYKNKKPIIVSQGSYAASGGYWLSMDANKIYSSPFTLTGSIGVISAWIYDKGMSDDLKINTTTLKRGKYSDLGASWALPIIGIGLPKRNLNDDERKQFDENINDLYKDFVERVSKGRNISYDSIHNVAQGRVWVGTDAKRNNLVDEIGTLWSTLEEVVKQAKISLDDKDLLIYQYPEGSFFDIRSLLGLSTKEKATIEEFDKVLYRLKNNGKILHLIPSDYEELEEIVK